ncbi:hypothetical protein SEPCBS57363_005174 [Sporothrix epigloea]|uniref:Myb/SANT-like domain-containing protein n=1 Tax=Sporothrix epigloea TaxID=1892477 RepID=A0ABP0DWC1_9PEZI
MSAQSLPHPLVVDLTGVLPAVPAKYPVAFAGPPGTNNVVYPTHVTEASRSAYAVKDIEAARSVVADREGATRLRIDYHDDESFQELARQVFNDVFELRNTPRPTDTGTPGLEVTAAAGVTAPKKIAAPRKRKRTVRDPTLLPLPGQAKIKHLKYSDEMNDAVMDLFLDETRKGTFRVMKGAAIAEGFERISDAMSHRYPIFAWGPEKIRSKYDTEKKKIRAWLAWRDGFPGATFDEKGVAVGTEEQKRLLLAMHPNQEWIFSNCLRNSERYLEIYFRLRATSQYANDAVETIDSESSANEVSSPSPPPSDMSSQAIRPSKRSRSATPPGPGPRRSKKTSTDNLAEVLDAAMSKITSSLNASIKDLAQSIESSKSASHQALEDAAKDAVNTFEGRLSPEQLGVCLRRLHAENEAIVWNVSPIKVKEVSVRRWLAEAGLPVI